MGEVIVEVPEEFEKIMGKHKLIDWSKIAEDALRERIAQVELLEAIASESKLTEEDAIELGRKINKSLFNNWYRKGVGAMASSPPKGRGFLAQLR